MKIKLLGSTIGLYHCSLSPGFGKENVPSRQCFAFFGAHDELGQYTAVSKEDFSKLPCGELYPKASTFTWITPEKTNIPKKIVFFVFICVHVCPVIEQTVNRLLFL